jgi:transcriptional regulator with XRE-family HTH domain
VRRKQEEAVLSETLREGLKEYGIGTRIRTLRLRKKLGLVELGRHTGLSPAMLSKIERGRVFPTLPTLLRIALVFSVGLDYFFAGSRQKPVVAVVRRKDRLRFPERPGARASAYVFESLDYPAVERRLSAYYAEFAGIDPGMLHYHQHAGGEFIYVLSGSLALHVGDDVHVAHFGDSIYFDPTVPHAYRRHGARPCAAVVVTTV